MSDTSSIDNTGGILKGLGSAVSDIFGGIGDEQAAAAYGKEAQIATQEAQISETSAAIQEAQETRAVTQAVGTEEATTASAGFTMGGNASDLMRQSIQQGALAKSLIEQQGTITTLGYQEQAEAAQGKASASKTSATGSFIGGALSIVGSLFSDRRLKENIVFLGTYGPHNIYAYNYKGSDVRCAGVMADEVEQIIPEAVTIDAETGFKKVNYDMLREWY